MRGAFALLAGACLLVPESAAADHGRDERITDQTAYTLRQGQGRVGLWKVQYGLTDSLTAGTYLLPWVVRMSNLHLKWRFLSSGTGASDLDLSVEGGVYRLDLGSFGALQGSDLEAVILTTPVELQGSYRFNDAFTVSLGVHGTVTSVDGDLSTEDLDGNGAAAADSVQLSTTVEWRLGPIWAFVLHARYLLLQRVRAELDTVIRPDDFTTLEVVGGASADDIQVSTGASVMVSSVWSWDLFNLRLGVGYGNYNVPGVNLALPEPTPLAEVDFYWVLDPPWERSTRLPAGTVAP